MNKRVCPTPLTLGTAQLGSLYGIANKTGKPDEEHALGILKTAFDNGIRSFDTARSYGESEDIIGAYIEANREAQRSSVIITKVPKIERIKSDDFGLICEKVRGYASESLKRLKIKKIPIYLLHDASDMVSYNGKVLKSLLSLKSEGIVDMLGVSVYYPEEFEKALSIREIEAIQIPVNLFDHRFITPGLLSKMIKNKKMIFARSIFLQGLFFLEPEALPHGVRSAHKYLKILHEFASEEGIDIRSLAMGFVKRLKAISSIIIGVESKRQVTENVEIYNNVEIDVKIEEKIMKIFSDIPEDIIIPSLWANKTKG